MTWRLLLDGAATGAWNMAVDEAILLAHAAGQVPPTLRFYDWNPACLSLGRLQKFDFPAKSDFDIVRRPTGGRAVWHQHEITYSAVVRADLLPQGASSVVGAYNWLSRGFLMGLQELGVLAALAPSGVRVGGANCFGASAGCDFLANGKKLIGAAQCRKDGAILQHGSILLSIDELAWQRTTGGSMLSATALRDLGVQVPRRTIIAALSAGFARAQDLMLEAGNLCLVETALARGLHDRKYGAACWTCTGQLLKPAGEAEVNT